MKCQKCGIEFEGAFCPSCGEKAVPVPLENQSMPLATATVQQKKSVFPIVLLVINLLATLILGGLIAWNTVGLKSNVKSDSIKEGKNLKISDVQYVESTYGSGDLKGTVKNTASYTLESVSIEYDFYHDDEYVGSGSDFITHIPAGETVNFSVYCPDEEIDSYAIYEVTARKKD